MYPPLLGKFVLPQEGHWSMPKEGWVAGVRYQPESLLAVRGAMNPWEVERTRELFMAEEAAWKKIIPLQAEVRAKHAVLLRTMAEYNRLILELEDVTGQKTGLEQVTGVTKFIPLPWFQVFNLFAGLFGGLLGGTSKKKKAEAIMRRLEAQQATMTALQVRLSVIGDEVSWLIQVGEGIRSGQLVKMTQEVAQSEQLYQNRQGLERLRASVLREKNRQAALMPRRQGGSDAL
jgi:hypothetical protein